MLATFLDRPAEADGRHVPGRMSGVILRLVPLPQHTPPALGAGAGDPLADLDLLAPDVEVVGSAADGREAVALADQTVPDWSSLTSGCRSRRC